MISQDTASRFARVTLSHLDREYPNMIQHAMTGPEEIGTPSQLHPIFYGSYDWHSCVHGWWQVMRLSRLYPQMEAATEVAERANAMMVPDKMAREIAYFARPHAGSYERPYGWAWALALHAEAAKHDGRGWAEVIEPLARFLADKFRDHLPKLTYPIRQGAHFNTAFALVVALDWARTYDAPLAALIEQRAKDWFSQDRGAQAWEPSGDDFLSPTLTEALLMSKVLEPAEFAAWFDAFLPDAAAGQPATLFTPAHVSDRSDGKIAHLDGLNLSRAWCWRGIAAALGEGHPLGSVAEDAAKRHIDVALDQVEGDYMGEHWLATYALLALGGL